MATQESRTLKVLNALFGPIVLFLAVPQGILLSNQHELLVDFSVAAPFCVAFLGLALLTARFAYRSHHLSCRVTTVFSVLAMLGLLFSLVRPLAPYLSVSRTIALDAALIGAVLWVTRVVPRTVLAPIFAAASCVFIAFAVMNTWTLHVGAWPNRQAVAPGAGSQLPARAPAAAPSELAGNVYHIVLDGFQRQAFERLLRQNPAMAPDDFVFFRHFEAAYSQTHFSLPSVLLGEYYKSDQPIRDWVYTSFGSRGLYRDLQNASIGLNVFPYYRYFCPDFAATCDDQVSAAGLSNSQSTLVDLWFQAILPGSLRALLNKPYHLDEPNDGEQPYGFSLTQTIGVRPVAPLYWHGVHSMRGFERFLKGESSRPSSRQYHFVHLILPHAPYLYDAHCEPYPVSANGVDTGKNEVPAYLDQAECGLRLVRTLIDTLKGLGRYESSTIIVHADHGTGLAFATGTQPVTDNGTEPAKFINFDRAASRPDQWPSAVISSWADALLLVKFPHQKGALKTLERPVGPLDLAPTVLRSFGLPVDRYEGTPLQDVMQGTSPGPIAHFTYALVDTGFPSTLSEYALQNGDWTYRRNVEVWGDVGAFFTNREIAQSVERQTFENVKAVGRQLRRNASRLGSSVAVGALNADSIAALGISGALLTEFKKAMGENLSITRYPEGFTVDLPAVPRRICEFLLTRAHEVPGAVRAGVTALAAREREVPITSEQAVADCAGQPESMFVRIITRD